MDKEEVRKMCHENVREFDFANREQYELTDELVDFIWDECNKEQYKKAMLGGFILNNIGDFSKKIDEILSLEDRKNIGDYLTKRLEEANKILKVHKNE